MEEREAMYQKISDAIKETDGPVFAVFDFDNTCIINDITEATLHYMARNDLFRDKTLLENTSTKAYAEAVFDNYYELLEKGEVKEAYIFISRILSGFEPGEVGSLAEKVIEFEGENITTEELFGKKIQRGITIRESVIDLMCFLRENGVEIWIASASLEPLVKEAARHFKVDAKVIAVRNTIFDGKITAQIEQPMPMFEGKVACIKKFIDSEKKPLLVAGDSMNDLPMLEYSRLKIVVDRQNELSEKAKENGWFLISK